MDQASALLIQKTIRQLDDLFRQSVIELDTLLEELQMAKYIVPSLSRFGSKEIALRNGLPFNTERDRPAEWFPMTVTITTMQLPSADRARDAPVYVIRVLADENTRLLERPFTPHVGARLLNRLDALADKLDMRLVFGVDTLPSKAFGLYNEARFLPTLSGTSVAFADSVAVAAYMEALGYKRQYDSDDLAYNNVFWYAPPGRKL